MIYYIPWTNSLILITWFNGKSLMADGHMESIGTATEDHLRRWGWQLIGEL